MCESFSSKAQPFVTKFTPVEIAISEQNFEDVEIITLHGAKSKVDDPTIDQIFVGHQKVGITVKHIYSDKECVQYLHENTDRICHLVLLQALTETDQLRVSQYAHVISIFQFDAVHPWIKEVYARNESQTLNPSIIQSLNAHHRLAHCDIAFSIRTELNTESPSQEFLKESRSFVQSQLLMELLLRASFGEESKEDFIDWCLQSYHNDRKHKETIDQFARDFKLDQVIPWYTRPSFIYRILNKTFSTNGFRYIFKIRYFICPLYSELKRLHEETFAVFDHKIQVYRGKIMSISDFNKFKASIGAFVVTKCFVSTSLNKTVAGFYAGETEVKDGHVGVIFHMKIDKFKNKSKPMAFVGEKSFIPDENEFLLAPGIVFYNRSINQIMVYEVLYNFFCYIDFFLGKYV